MTFDETIAMIRKAKDLYELTGDVVLNEAIRIISPLLAAPEAPLSLQQQTAMTYLVSTIRQYHELFGYPSEE